MKQKFNKAELIKELQNQLDKIADFASMYDSGKTTYAQDIAVKLRVIFHNTNNSKSLLRQLKLEHIPFVDSAKRYSSTNMLSHNGLISSQTIVGPGHDGSWSYIAPLEKAVIQIVGFENWWDSKKVIADGQRNIFTRRKLILELADTDGGAHVDEGLKEDYHKLTRQNSLGWVQMDQWGKSEAMGNPVPPSIRQIAFETIETFKKIDVDKESRLR